MREKIKTYGAIALLLILIPYMITLFFHGGGVGLFQEKSSSSELEEKVIQLVSEQVSGQAQMEAIKAQAVIARTQLYQNPTMEVTGNETNLLENMDTLQFCVEETQGEILTYEGRPIDPAYHAVSGKFTRNGSEVTGQEDKSYLKSVESLYDISSPDYLTIVYMEKADFAAKIQGLIADSQVVVNPETVLTDLVIEARDSAEYVTKVRYADVILNGEAVRDALELPSALFYFSELNGKVRILVKGLGHGLGLSQYGANAMASEGKDYEEILQYYYSEVEIERVKSK